jgi:two-component system sensor histidine kinase KdpD
MWLVNTKKGVTVGLNEPGNVRCGLLQAHSLTPHRHQNRYGTYLWGVFAPGLCTLINWPLRHTLGPASILMIYLLGVFLVATRFGRGASTIASLLSAPAFAFFFAPPIFSLAISDIENIIGLVVMMVVANVTSNLLERVRFQADIAAQRESLTTALYRLSRSLSDAQDEQTVLQMAVSHIYDEFGASSVLLLPDAASQLRYPADNPLRQSLRSADLGSAQWVFDNKTPIAGNNADMKVKGQVAYHPLEGSHGRVGIMAMQTAPAGNLFDLEVMTFLNTFLNQIAQALVRVRLATQAREATLQADAEALRNSLLSAISHDLRTPLTRIMGAAGILAERESSLDPEERIDFKKLILDEAERMSELMNKILDMARITAGTISPQWEWNAVEEVVGGTLSRLDKALDDRPVNISLPDGLPLVWMDAVLVQQVLTNLVENAIKYTPSGSPIDISASVQPSALWLEVADRGPGIPVGLEDRLFEKFFRLEAESPQTGVGLGLSLCRAIAEAHGGGIGAANRPDGGTVFILSLPLREPPAMEREEESRQ